MTRCGSWVILYAKRDNWLTVDPYALECKPRGSEPGGLLLFLIVVAMMELVDVEQGTKHSAACHNDSTDLSDRPRHGIHLLLKRRKVKQKYTLRNDDEG